MEWFTPPLVWFWTVFVALICWCVHRFLTRPGSRIAAIKDWLAYVAIGIALVVGIVLLAAYGPDKLPIEPKWIGFAFNALFVFGYTLKVARPLWAKPKLWAVVAGAVLLHAIVGFSVLVRVGRIPLVWYVPVDMAEIWAALIAIQAACRTTLPPMQES
ncbi:MAG TPA: hypothetical protein VFI95_04420 [Terriglobales bacterium]|nr:hypothetical protein [Terriglobales bacterium]